MAMTPRTGNTNNSRGKSRRPGRFKREQSEFEQQIVEISRVTRVMAGGKRMRFRACVVIGDKNGRVGMGLAKAKDVPQAVQKAVKKAETTLIRVPLAKDTIPHAVEIKDGAARVLLKPAPSGTGIISGGAVRVVLEYAGVRNVVSKILGSNNKVNNIRATLKALSLLQPVSTKTKKKVAPVAESIQS